MSKRCKCCKVVDTYIKKKKFPESMSKIEWGNLDSLLQWIKDNPEDYKKFNEIQPSYKDVIKKYGVELGNELYDKLEANGKLWGTYSADASEQEKREGHFFYQNDIDQILKNGKLYSSIDDLQERK